MELIAIRLVKHHNNDNVTMTASFPQLVRLQVASQVRRVLAAHAQGRYCKRDILVETQYALGKFLISHCQFLSERREQRRVQGSRRRSPDH